MTIIQKGESMTDTELKRRKAICEAAHVDEIDDVSDGFHTFRQLYYQRMMLFATIVKQNKDKAWKSLRHEDGKLCFGGGWFIVGIDTPEGSYTYHYEDNYYSLFDCEELERGKHWDGHTEKDVTRLLSLPSAIELLPAVQPNHTADIGKKVSISCAHENDVIFREAAIEALARMMPRSYTPDGSHPADEEIFRAQEVFADCIEALEILPSAQPATNCSEIPNNSDTISRQAAIDALDKRFDDVPMELSAEILQLRRDLRALPPSAPSTAHTTETTAPSTDGWIPISKKTNPTKSGWYLVTVHEDVTNDNDRFTGMAEFNATNGMWYDIDEPTDMYLRWRPLPEPYRGGDSD